MVLPFAAQPARERPETDALPKRQPADCGDQRTLVSAEIEISAEIISSGRPARSSPGLPPLKLLSPLLIVFSRAPTVVLPTCWLSTLFCASPRISNPEGLSPLYFKARKTKARVGIKDGAPAVWQGREKATTKGGPPASRIEKSRNVTHLPNALFYFNALSL
jgi:hypothetical protein